MKDFEKYLKDPIFMQMVKKYAEESERFNKNKSKIDKEHDKIIKRVFESKKEAARFISKVIGKKIRAKDLIPAKNNFVTTELKYREADIVYKIKGTNVVILIEHQTKVDYKMSYRILNYQVEIMRAYEEENTECLVIPIVLYTGKGKWTAKRSVRELQEKFLGELKKKPELGDLGYYELVDIKDFEEKELLEDNGTLSKILLLEKVRNTENLIKTVFEINKKILKKTEDEKSIVHDTMRLILIRKLGEKETDLLMEKIVKEGSDYMLAAEQMVIDENKRIRAEGRKEGILAGKAVGRTEGIITTAKNMLKKKIDINIIEEVTGLKREQFK